MLILQPMRGAASHRNARGEPDPAQQLRQAGPLIRCKASLDAFLATDHLPRVIRTFRSRALRRYFESGDARGLSVQNVDRMGRILRALDVATLPEQMNLPGNHFHILRGARRWSIRVTGNWRVTFGWDRTDAIDVDLEDYH